MSLSSTCANCDNLRGNQLPMMGFVYSCLHSGTVVPQHTVDEGDGTWLITFWRVPPSCPRGDRKKSEEKAPHDEWVQVKVTRKDGDLLEVVNV